MEIDFQIRIQMQLLLFFFFNYQISGPLKRLEHPNYQILLNQTRNSNVSKYVGPNVKFVVFVLFRILLILNCKHPKLWIKHNAIAIQFQNTKGSIINFTFVMCFIHFQ